MKFNPARPRMAAGALILNDLGQVMILRPTYKETWDIPGGYVEPGESPLHACKREIREEIGLDLEPTSLAAVDWAPAEGEGEKILFVFCGETLTSNQLSRIALQPEEVSEYRFVSAADLDQFMIPRLVRRITAAVDAKDTGQPAYLEHGELVP